MSYLVVTQSFSGARPVRAGARGLAPVPVAQLDTGFVVTQLLIWVVLR